MSTLPSPTPWTGSPFEQLAFARAILRQAAEAICHVAQGLPEEFCEAVRLCKQASGAVITTGIGKAGIIGQKIAATLASTGTPSHFLHPAEAMHGDLGRVTSRDVVIAFSFSGETEEVLRLIPSLQEMGVPIISITSSRSSSLAAASTVPLTIGPLREACVNGLAPSTSTTTMLALGDALSLVLSRVKGFDAEDFARFHPGGSLGRKLARVDEIMRPISQCRLASESDSLRQVLVHTNRQGRRTGAVMLIDAGRHLTGIFTDSDLAKLLERSPETVLERPIATVMTRSPTTIQSGARITDAIQRMARHKISELPVVDFERVPIGLIDITDLMGLFPDSSPPVEGRAASGGDNGEPFADTVPFPQPRISPPT